MARLTFGIRIALRGTNAEVSALAATIRALLEQTTEAHADVSGHGLDLALDAEDTPALAELAPVEIETLDVPITDPAASVDDTDQTHADSFSPDY